MSIYSTDFGKEFPDFYPFQNTPNSEMEDEKKTFRVNEILEKFLNISEDQDMNWRN